MNTSKRVVTLLKRDGVVIARFAPRAAVAAVAVTSTTTGATFTIEGL